MALRAEAARVSALCGPFYVASTYPFWSHIHTFPTELLAYGEDRSPISLLAHLASFSQL